MLLQCKEEVKYIFAPLIIFCVFTDFRQEKTLRDEISSIQELTNLEQMDMDAINEKLNRTVTTGDYRSV